ncbi:FAD-binding protein [Methylomarinum vadi]|uniref:FAD-binding protein n=1 Tax=Methylomarinum vadi TaxID=438855 RepID=UPI0004DF31BA|nr:FAD-binding protein [Methylomarinum vadi]
MTNTQIEAALTAWKNALGTNAIVNDIDTLRIGAANCIGIQRHIPAILYPKSAQDVAQIVRIAGQYKVPLYPYSTGRNWGYGSSNPTRDDCVLVDLSRMKRIIEFDAEIGLLTIEPGVTQRMLDTYLKQHRLPFMVPVTGAGPDCSLVGNAFERGYGITPYADHFGAVMGLEAVLPNGDTYRSMLSGLGGEMIDKSFKWGMGPYVEGLLSQSNFGIVTQMTIALAPLPERVEAFFFSVKKADELELAVKKIRQVLREVGAVTGSINLMNKHRVLSMSESYPKDRLGPDGLIPESVLKEMMRRNQVMEWTAVGAIYGNKQIVAAARGQIRKILRPVAKRLIFFTPRLVKFMHGTAQTLPIIRNLHLVNVLGTLHKTMQLFAGEPSEIALPLSYWRSGTLPPDGKPMNPAQDGCGLIWYSPLVPMKPNLTREYVNMVTNICVKYRIEPLITLTSLSERCWDSTVPILYDRQNPEEMERAQACYKELLENGRKLGFIPYRLGIQSMNFPEENNAVPEVLKTIKSAIDPNHIIAPGRYGLS